MKTILFAFIVLLFNVSIVNASEITGRISTDPQALVGDNGAPTSEPPANIPNAPAATPAAGGSLIIPPVLNNKDLAVKESAKAISPSGGSAGNDQPEKVAVLGASLYPDGALLRDSRKRVYLISGLAKKHIQNLKDLQKFRGRIIHDASDEELAQYKFMDGNLIREKGTPKIYTVSRGRKVYVKNLDELRRYYFGLEIFNITQKEMNTY